jgi:sarcosine oxidase
MPGPQIAVIGLGATGSAALCQLARRGVRTIGIEQFEIGHDRGSSHGATRMIRLAHFERPSYVPLMRRAYALWHELEDIVQQKLLHITGIAEIGPPAGDVVRGTRAGPNSDVPCELLDAASLMRRYPAFKIPESFVAVFQPDGGFIEASKALAATIAVAKQHGAAIRAGEKVIAVEAAGAGVRVVTDRGAIAADFAIVAAGPWLCGLFPELHLPLKVTRQVIGWFEPPQPEQFAAGRFPAFMFESNTASITASRPMATKASNSPSIIILARPCMPTITSEESHRKTKRQFAHRWRSICPPPTVQCGRRKPASTP